MHDDFFTPMADETRALLDIAREEAPDWILVLHSHESPPAVLSTAYIPRTAKESAARFAERLAGRLREAGLPSGGIPPVGEDGTKGGPPSFNLASALHHASGGIPVLFECPHGTWDPPYPRVTHDEILDIGLTLLEELTIAAGEERPAGWSPPGRG